MDYINQELLDALESIARAAGTEIMAIYNRDFAVAEKEDKSPLTEADSAAHNLIVARLQTLSLKLPILSEEDTDSFAGTDAQGRYWLVDPLDGTKEFIKRNGEFTVNIALIEQGEPVLGVVYAPAINTAYCAARGLGAVKVTEQGERIAIQVAQPPVDRPWRVVGSRSHAGAETEAWLSDLGEYELVPMGSSLKLCLVAEGAADIYPRLGLTSLWDTAAAHAVVNQAGGEVVQLNGQPLSYSSTNEVLNPHFIVRAVTP
ncbi:MAG: 3'(2'),5'-bisphosphate nucleotidase CysQ [Thiopseudomonas sp.]|nr:3'(2'),5'-bisphosphate nucleotidase CysQ [Thiopseudomonas sp.]MCK9464754.1 3'(2'),5'-bisphosphate nucleotidase CysQ [Thiopseudomonas sp.]